MTSPAVLIVAIAGATVGGVCAWRWPRGTLVAVALAPIIDRYLVSLLVPVDLRAATVFVSEGLLAGATAAILLQAARAGTLKRAASHPVIWLLGLFIGLSALSALVNGVEVGVAIAGTLFTVDAAVLFLLAHAATLSARPGSVAVLAFVGIASLAALLAMGQVLLHPDFLGLETFTGRFGEGARVASFLVNPNMLGAILAMALPFPVLAGLGWQGRRRAGAWAVALLLALALLYTFSRGSWLALAVATAFVTLAVDRRFLLAMALLAAIVFGLANVLPRHLLDPNRGAGFDLMAATLGRVGALGEGDLRVQFIENALPIVADHPLIGSGPGRYGGAVARNVGSPLYETYTEGTVPAGRTVDNFWLHLLVEAGLLGALCFLAAIGRATLEGLQRARASLGTVRIVCGGAAAMAIVLVMASLTEMLLEGNTTAFTMWLLLGVATLPTAATSTVAAEAQNASR